MWVHTKRNTIARTTLTFKNKISKKILQRAHVFYIYNLMRAYTNLPIGRWWMVTAVLNRPPPRLTKCGSSAATRRPPGCEVSFFLSDIWKNKIQLDMSEYGECIIMSVWGPAVYGFNAPRVLFSDHFRDARKCTILRYILWMCHTKFGAACLMFDDSCYSTTQLFPEKCNRHIYVSTMWTARKNMILMETQKLHPVETNIKTSMRICV